LNIIEFPIDIFEYRITISLETEKHIQYSLEDATRRLCVREGSYDETSIDRLPRV
jgi:hypothetical protein